MPARTVGGVDVHFVAVGRHGDLCRRLWVSCPPGREVGEDARVRSPLKACAVSGALTSWWMSAILSGCKGLWTVDFAGASEEDERELHALLVFGLTLRFRFLLTRLAVLLSNRLLEMSLAPQKQPCEVCGALTTFRCSACEKVGISLHFCSGEHQSLVSAQEARTDGTEFIRLGCAQVWHVHRLVCGPKAHPISIPPLTPDELADAKRRANDPLKSLDEGPMTLAFDLQIISKKPLDVRFRVSLCALAGTALTLMRSAHPRASLR